MFSAKPSAPAAGGLSINTSAANSLFGNTPTTSTTQPAAGGSLFGQSKPAGSLFGNTPAAGNTQASGQSLFGSLGATPSGAQQQSGTPATGGLFGASTAAKPPGGLFGGNTTNTQQQSGAPGGGLFGNQSTTQAPARPMFGATGTSTTGGLFGATQNPAQPQQQQQQQMPTLSLFGGQSTTAPPQQQSAAGPTTVVQGVKVDVSNLLPTTKFESCADELKKQIETIDSFILNQIHMCNEVSDLLPTISNQGATIPNDVGYVQGKLDTMQHALENDARDIDQVRKLVTRDAAEAQVAFRAIDNLKLPLQYQTSNGGWWSVSEQQHSERQSLRSSMRNRKSTLALPDDVEGDPSTTDSVNGVPVNLIDYFSHRADEMHTVVDGYKKNLKEIEDHLHGVESTLSRQINEFVSSRNRDGGAGNGSTAKSQLADLAAALGDVEAGILGVASRLGGVKEEVQELILGPPTLGVGRLG